MESERRYGDKEKASDCERAPFVRAANANVAENKAYDSTEKASNPRLEGRDVSPEKRKRKRRSSFAAEVSLTVREEKVESEQV